MHDSTQDISTEMVGSEHMATGEPLRRTEHIAQLLLIGVEGRQVWAKDPELDECENDDSAKEDLRA
jgi:hypothetical protein